MRIIYWQFGNSKGVNLMLMETAKLLIEAAESEDIEAELTEGYSGRGMYGETTIAVEVTGDRDTFTLIIGRATALCGEQGSDTDKFLAQVRKLRTDSMGRDGIVIY